MKRLRPRTTSWYDVYAEISGEQTKLLGFSIRSMASGTAFHCAFIHATRQTFLEAHDLDFAYFDAGEMGLVGASLACPIGGSFSALQSHPLATQHFLVTAPKVNSFPAIKLPGSSQPPFLD